jgi:exodeoxyribonuclease V alpha subunit
MSHNHQSSGLSVREYSSIEGILERIVYFNEENNYTVARLQVARNPELVTIVGSMPCPNPGETLRLRGQWVVDAKFGRQFRVESCLSVLPAGDTDQLPSVGPGNVLKDIIASGRVETVRLTEVFRQAQESMIVVNAHQVNRGEFPITRAPVGKKADFYFVERDKPEKVVEVVKELCARRLPRVFRFNPFDDIQVMTPMHKDLPGVANLNAELQMLLNPTGKEVIRGGRCFRINDKVMQIINNYEKEVFNGDIGRVVRIEHEEQKLAVKYEDRVVDYD